MSKTASSSTTTTIPEAAAAAVPAAAPTDAIVDRWFADHFGGSGLSTEQHNRFRAAADALKEQLAALVHSK